MVTYVEPVVLSVVQDEMLRKMRTQSYQLDGHNCPIEYLAGRLSWDIDQLCEALAMEVGQAVDLGGSELKRVD